MSEYIGPVSVEFSEAYDPSKKEIWACRGRVKFAAITAVGKIGKADPPILKKLRDYLQEPAEDNGIKAAAAKTLGLLCDRESLPVLEKLAQNDSEWCMQNEAIKAVRIICKSK